MSKQVKVIVIRHGKKENKGYGTMSWSITSRLTPEGVETAKQVARKLKPVLETCVHFYASPLVRAQETAFTVMEELGMSPAGFEGVFRPLEGLWSGSPSVWYDDCDPSQYSNGRIYKQSPTRVKDEGHQVLCAIDTIVDTVLDDWIDQIGDPDYVLVAFAVSHGGPLDSAIMLAKQRLGQQVEIGDVKEGEGAIFTFEDETMSLIAVEDFTL